MTWHPTIEISANVDDSVAQHVANWAAIATFAKKEHSAIDNASPVHSAGECSVLHVGSTTTIAALAPVACACAWSTSLKDFFTFTATTSSNRGGFVPSGTKMLFYQDTAPTGWTIDTSVNDKLAFVTKGSGAGGQAGGGAHSGSNWTISGYSTNVGSHTLTLSELPSHAHSMILYTRVWAGAPTAGIYWVRGTGTYLDSTSSAVGGGGSHTHAMASHSGLWRPSAYNCMICSKD